jgi:hypothetical protein
MERGCCWLGWLTSRALLVAGACGTPCVPGYCMAPTLAQGSSASFISCSAQLMAGLATNCILIILHVWSAVLSWIHKSGMCVYWQQVMAAMAAVAADLVLGVKTVLQAVVGVDSNISARRITYSCS